MTAFVDPLAQNFQIVFQQDKVCGGENRLTIQLAVPAIFLPSGIEKRTIYRLSARFERRPVAVACSLILTSHSGACEATTPLAAAVPETPCRAIWPGRPTCPLGR